MKFAIGAIAVVTLAGCAVESANIGSRAPDAKLEMLTEPGKMVSIQGQSNVRIIDFWATWCGPCRQSMPFIENLHKKYKDKGVQVMGVTDEPRGVVEKFHQELGYDYPIFLDSYGDANRRYAVRAIPHVVVIGKNGIIRWMGSPFDTEGVTEAVESALAQ